MRVGPQDGISTPKRRERDTRAHSLSLPSEDTASQEERPHRNPNHAGTLASDFQPPDGSSRPVLNTLVRQPEQGKTEAQWSDPSLPVPKGGACQRGPMPRACRPQVEQGQTLFEELGLLKAGACS